MINPATGDIKYIDFGLSCYSTQCIGVLDKARGSPPYMPPELFLANRLGTITPRDLQTWFSADMWELGATICELIVGEPFINYYFYVYHKKEVDEFYEIIQMNEEIVTKGQGEFHRNVQYFHTERSKSKIICFR